MLPNILTLIYGIILSETLTFKIRMQRTISLSLYNNNQLKITIMKVVFTKEE